MKKFSLLKYLDPYDSYDNTSSLSDEDRNYFSTHKSSDILKKGEEEAREILTYLNSVLEYIEGDRYMSNFIFGRDGRSSEVEEISNLIKRIRKKLMDVNRLKKRVKSKKHFNKK